MIRLTKKQLKKSKALTLAIMLVILIIPLISCTSLRKKNNNNYVWIPVPDPIVDGQSVVVLEGDEVKMPLWYWKKIVTYITVTEANIEKLER